MRIEGTLKKWNDERGFGFILPKHGGQEVFVHISSFPRDGRRPVVDERLFFEVALGRDGKKQAIKLARPERATAFGRPSPTDHQHATRRGGLLGGAVMLALLAALGFYGHSEWSGRRAALLRNASANDSPTDASAPTAPQAVITARCDARTHCSQMTSCAEAKFFLKNCPGVQMDGNRDGVPCEQQWCTSPFAR